MVNALVLLNVDRDKVNDVAEKAFRIEAFPRFIPWRGGMTWPR